MAGSYSTMKCAHRRTALALLLAIASTCSHAQQRPAPIPEGCRYIHNTYGPFDYRTAHHSQKFIVENRHFTHGIETLARGATTDFGGNIEYTIAVFPNHGRAIKTMERLVELEKSEPAAGAGNTVECYYLRGMAFVPDDLVLRMLYVDFLIKRKRLDDARTSLDFVVSQAADNPLTHFNAGLLYFDLKDYDKALAQAHRAQAMGMTRPDLRDRLTSVGRWKEPEPSSEPAASQPGR